MTQHLFNWLRPLAGLSLAAGFMFLFRPLLTGLLRAALLLVAPRKSLTQRKEEARAHGIRLMNRYASQWQSSQPNLAAEIRTMAGRC